MAIVEQPLLSVGITPTKITDLSVQDVLRILVLPDLHIPFGQAQKELLLSNRAFLDRHDWVVLLGDMTACYGTRGEYASVRAFVEELARPYGVVNGNHEFFFRPFDDSSGEYGHVYQPGNDRTQRAQVRRFERFYQIESRFQAGLYNGAGVCLLGLDRIDPFDTALLDKENESWFATVLDEFANAPLIVFSHFPLCTERLTAVRYYAEGRRPYYLPMESVRATLQGRRFPTFWFSGHLHLGPTHPLFAPYQTETGVWQLHCPDGLGYGRPNNDLWHPQPHDGLFVRSVELKRSGLVVATIDLRTLTEISSHQFGFDSRAL